MTLERYSFFIALVFAVILGGFVEYTMRVGIAPCHEITVTDTLTIENSDTVIVPNTKIIVQRQIITKIDTIWLRAVDSLSVARIDTVMEDGALIGVETKAALIIPPMRQTVFYTPPARIERTIRVPVVEYRTDWRSVTLAGLVGLTTGMIVDRVVAR